MAEQQARPRGRTAIIFAVAALLGVGIGIAVVTFSGRSDEPGQGVPVSISSPAAPPPSSSAPATTDSPDDVSARGADGCLGGSDPYTAVLTAQQEATIDDPGAAAFARSVARWALSYPSDPNSASTMGSLAAPGGGWARTAPTATDSDTRLRQAGFVSSRIEPSSRYRVTAPVVVDSPTARGASVQVELTRVLAKSDGSEESAVFKTELVLEEVAGVWTVVGTLPEQAMSPEIPGNPWVLYTGGC